MAWLTLTPELGASGAPRAGGLARRPV